MSVDPAVHTAASAPLSHYLLADAMARDPFNLESRYAATRRRWVKEQLAVSLRTNSYRGERVGLMLRFCMTPPVNAACICRTTPLSYGTYGYGLCSKFSCVRKLPVDQPRAVQL